MRAVPRLHVVTDDAVLAREGWGRLAAGVLEAGGAALALHVRGPRTGGARLCAACAELLPLAASSGSCLLVNDRVDVALALGVAGVHLGQRSLDAASARRLFGSERLIGVSCRTPDHVRSARAAGADYVIGGNVFGTPSHPDREGMGVEGLAELVRSEQGAPVIAIGGVSVERVARVLAAGAHGVAVLRGVWDAAHPASAVSAYISMLSESQDLGSAGGRR